MLFAGGCVALSPGEESSDGDDPGSSVEATSAVGESGAADGDGHSSYASMTDTASGEATSHDPGTDSASSVSSGTGGPVDEPTALCGVDVIHDQAQNNEYLCACEACNVTFPNLEPASGEALLAVCECICYEIGCGGTVSGGITSDGGSGWDTGWDETGDDTATASASVGSTDFGSDDGASSSG